MNRTHQHNSLGPKREGGELEITVIAISKIQTIITTQERINAFTMGMVQVQLSHINEYPTKKPCLDRLSGS
jgi:hypothetical protein